MAAAEEHLTRYLSVEGFSGEEKAIAEAIIDDLKAMGMPAPAIAFDDANKRIPRPTQTGNLYVRLPGTRPGKPLVFATHMDVVPLCAGAKPKRSGNKIVTDGATALGGDNRTGCAVLVTLADTLLKQNLPHPPITLLFTVREESGLQGARYMDPAVLKGAAMCFNVDNKVLADLITGAVGAERWDVEIIGNAAHAGVAPDKGISSTMVAALALAEVRKGGWFGKVAKGKHRGTSNAGIFGGKDGTTAAGNATNVVTDYAYLRVETRSPDAKFAAAITAAYKPAFLNAAKQVKDHKGGTAKVKFVSRAEYPSFNLDDKSPAVVHAKNAGLSLGLKPKTLFSNGGLDANRFVRYGLTTVTIGAGQYEIHTLKEYVNLPEYADGCRLAVALATLD